jgi:hypothetical protein
MLFIPELRAKFVMIEPNITGIANDKEKSIRDYIVFDPIVMNSKIKARDYYSSNLNSNL